ncbi:hypothetical protein [Bradyrhizobium sp. RT3b]|uniref:hypothetical protein n=1 Tax=Bradyrhizobium sp. RT3b TaxID=3156334 RepID=UPI0033993FAA
MKETIVMRCFAPRSKAKRLICLRQKEDNAGRASPRIAIAVVLTLITSSGASYGQTGGAESHAAPAPQQPPAPSAASPQGEGLNDLSAKTFSCVRAGLNAAAREAAKAPSQGTYQFSFFKIIKDAHHSFYEVHFRSNYSGEPDLKYCVAIYCQQGWDPNTAQITVNSVGEKRKLARAATHAADCGNEQMPSRSGPQR